MQKLIDDFAKVPLKFKAAGALGVVALIIVFNYFFFVSSYESEISEMRTRIEAQEQEVATLQARADFKAQYQREIELLKQKRREAEERLPKEQEVPKLLRDISYEASQSGLVVDRFEIGAERLQGDFAAVPVQMRVQGSYHEVAVFLDRVSKLERIVNVTDIAMKQPKFVNKKIVLASDFTATTYRFVERGAK